MLCSSLTIHINSVCPTAGTQKFLWDMKWDVVSEWKPWTFQDTFGTQVGGFKVTLNNTRGT